MKLKNVYLNKLKVGTIMDIADDLGCPIKYPHVDLNLSGERDNEIVMKENDQRIRDYMDAIIDWLEDNNYLGEDLPHDSN